MRLSLADERPQEAQHIIPWLYSRALDLKYCALNYCRMLILGVASNSVWLVVHVVQFVNIDDTCLK